MKLSDSRGVKTALWYTNELLRQEDINSLGDMQYQTVVDIFSALVAGRSSGAGYVIGGLDITWNTALTFNLKSGIAISKTGAYLEGDTWGFIPNVEKAFVVVVPEDVSVGLTAGGTLDRIDIIQIRPIINTYNSKSRNFKDPVTGLVTTALIPIRKEYTYEFSVLTGTEAVSPVAPTPTAGWVGLVQVYVASGVSVLSDSVVTPIAFSTFDSNSGYSVLSSDTILKSKGKYYIDSPAVITLPASLNIGDVIKISTEQETRIAQSHPSALITLRRNLYTTKGVYDPTPGSEKGCLITRPGDTVELMYKGVDDRGFDALIKLPNPGTLPSGIGDEVVFSADGVYMAIPTGASPYINIYKRSGDTFTRLSNPSDLPTGWGYSVSFSSDATYLAVGHATSRYVTIYKRSGDTFTKLTDPLILPTNTVYGICFSADDTYLAVALADAPPVIIYKRSGDTFTKLTDPASLPPVNCISACFSPNGDYLAIGGAGGTYIYIYKRSGDTFTLLSNPSSLPPSTVYGISFSADSTYMAVASSSLLIYKRSGDTFTKLSDPAILPTGACQAVNFSPDDKYLAVAHATSPYMTIYEKSGDTFTKLSDPLSLPNSNGYGIDISIGNAYVALTTVNTPYVHLYKPFGVSNNTWVLVEIDVEDNSYIAAMFK